MTTPRADNAGIRSGRLVQPRGSRLTWVWVVTPLFCWGFTVVAWGQPGSDPRRSAEVLARGQSLYLSLCQRCHGGDGDAVDYPGVVPLAGIHLRLPDARIADLSAPFVGRSFHGEEAEALVAYISRLRGAKGFARPEHLFSSYLLEKKLGETTHYRIIDARPESAYAGGHIPNAVNWDRSHDLEHPQTEADLWRALSGLGVGPDTFVVIYDEAGGPTAARLWWRLQEQGFHRSAVLDGGWEAWQAFRGPSTTRIPEFAASAIPEPVSKSTRFQITRLDSQVRNLRLGSGESADFDWTQTTGGDGLLHSVEVTRVLAKAGIQAPAAFTIDGSPEETAFLLFLLVLTGADPAYEAETRRLFLRVNPAPPAVAGYRREVWRRINLPREVSKEILSVASGSSRLEAP